MNITSVTLVHNAIKLQTSVSFASETTSRCCEHRMHSETIKNTLYIPPHIYLMVAFAQLLLCEAQQKIRRKNDKQNMYLKFLISKHANIDLRTAQPNMHNAKKKK